MKRGITISFDGIDGCGKTTQIQLAKEYFEMLGLKTIVTKAIGSDLHPATFQLRDIALNSSYGLLPKAQQLIFSANSYIFRQQVLPKLRQEYDIILIDRGYFSFHAYGQSLLNDSTWLSLVSDFIGENYPEDFTFIFDIDPDVSYERIKGREQESFKNGGKDNIEERGVEFQKTVREMFLGFASNGYYNIALIDVNNKDVKEVYNEVINHDFTNSIIGSIQQGK